MVDRIAIKVLSASDLTFFDAYYKKSNVGNQKSINLNADVFSKEFYPSLGERAVGVSIEIPVSVTVFGPTTSRPYSFARSVTKGTTYKNWRLNGAAVPDPEAEPGRFARLQPNDLAVLEFSGEPAPNSVRIVVLSGADDPILSKSLAMQVPGGKRTMVSISRAELGNLVDRAGTPPEHPIRHLVRDSELEMDLEEASFGGEPAARKLRMRTGRSITIAELLSARAAAEKVGSDGEAIAYIYLSQLKDQGYYSELQWSSLTDAAASWDFIAKTEGGNTIRFDAKSTRGPFGRPIHISGAEVAAAADLSIGYRIIRVFLLSEEKASIRISKDINKFAKDIIETCDHLSNGIIPTGFSIDPVTFSWEDEQIVERPDNPE